ncbi:helix-turn-helix transcriptional regulator [Streptomyces luteireticuli]|uniref:HTH cro/C1-type domain-containing protein n=1 Tax=Streptomyces luteireticuli TaxID=173858 RepID=A0ABP3IF66_9ACTN
MESTAVERTPAAGENIQLLRKSRGMSQTKLARTASVSTSLLSKIEQGIRAASPPVVAAIAEALHVSTARIYGQPFMGPSEQSDLMTKLRTVVRGYTLPKEDVPPPEELAKDLRKAGELRASTKYLELLRMLPRLLGQVTAAAMEEPGETVVWSDVADVYGCAYSVAHRLVQPDLADLVVARQTWAARQTWNPRAEAGAAWNEAGTHQSAGHYGDGLAIIDRAITGYERALRLGPATQEEVHALGSLHLRGVVLASRAKDHGATRSHVEKAKALAEQMPHDVLAHNTTFGPGNVALYELASHIELGRPDEATELSGPLIRTPPQGLRPSRIGRLCIDAARAHLAVNDHSGAEEALRQAHKVTPQMAQVHPMAREVLRVLVIHHERSKPELVTMAQRSGLMAEL